MTLALWLAQAVPDSSVPEVVTDPDNQLLVLGLGTLIPLLTALVTRYAAHPGVKAVTTLFLAACAGLLSQVVDGGEIFNAELVVTAAIEWVIAVATYYGLWKPTGAAPAIQRRTANLGIGGGTYPPPPG